VVVVMESTVSVAVAAEVPLIVVLVDEQVGEAVAPAGPVTTQVRFTAPVKPPNGVTVMVALMEAPGLARVRLTGPVTPIFGTGTPLTVMPMPLEVDAL
jgi:acyl dehydratase